MMKATAWRLAAAAATLAAGWAVAGTVSACPVGRPVLANGSPGVAVAKETDEGRGLCRVRFVSGVELAYDDSKIVPATPADSRVERPVPGTTLPIASALRGGARLCRPGVDVMHDGKRATVMSVRTEGDQRICTLRAEGEPTLSLRSGDIKIAEDRLLPVD